MMPSWRYSKLHIILLSSNQQLLSSATTFVAMTSQTGVNEGSFFAIFFLRIHPMTKAQLCQRSNDTGSANQWLFRQQSRARHTGREDALVHMPPKVNR